MDEKYLELRTKLDYARESGMKKVQKAEKIARELRMKYALAGGNTLLDKIGLPDIFTNGSTGRNFIDSSFFCCCFCCSFLFIPVIVSGIVIVIVIIITKL